MTTSEIAIARRTAGYRPPPDVDACCRNCGAVRQNRKFKCLRGGFTVHSLGVCSYFSRAPYVPQSATGPTEKPLFVQPELQLQAGRCHRQKG